MAASLAFAGGTNDNAPSGTELLYVLHFEVDRCLILQDGQSSGNERLGGQAIRVEKHGGVYSCSCPAWRNQSVTIERRTCKHLRKLRGDAAEETRIGGALPQKAVAARDEEGDGSAGPPLLLAQSWDNAAADLSGWWMSEKLDGVRAYWDGKQFISRLGNLFHAPDWFIDGLPSSALDGELWIDRKKFQRTVSIVRRQDKSELWREVRYLIFDAPAAGGPFEERLAFIKDVVAGRKLEFVRQHEHQRCQNTLALRDELARVEAARRRGPDAARTGVEIRSGPLFHAAESENVS